jgi:ATP-dependent helicase/nuclease subunit A
MFTIVQASAGSGKTFNLAAIYVQQLLIQPSAYQHILAVTFTNKATTELKIRILDFLHALAQPPDQWTETAHKLYAYIKDKKRLAAEQLAYVPQQSSLISLRAATALQYVLYNYNQFAVQTIDSFFQRIVRQFGREMSIDANLQIELDNQYVLNESIHYLFEHAHENPLLYQWIDRFVRERVEETGKVDVKKHLEAIGQTLFQERSFLALSQQSQAIFQTSANQQPEQQAALMNRLLERINLILKFSKKEYKNYIKTRQSICNEFAALVMRHGMELKQLTKGISTTIENGASGKMALTFGKNFLKAVESESWTKKDFVKENPHLKSALAQIEPQISALGHRLIDWVSEHETKALLYHDLADNLHGYGLLYFLRKAMRQWLISQRKLLLSDVAPQIQQLIQGCDAPFIYERIGQRFQHYLIDEFQDTSTIQWANFKPLIEESLSNGYEVMVVGDVKQAIYRFRNGNYNLLLQEAAESLAAHQELIQTYRLDRNFRSRPSIIRFNNALFSALVDRADELLPAHFAAEVRAIYNGHEQIIGKSVEVEANGFVQLVWLQKPNKSKSATPKIQDVSTADNLDEIAETVEESASETTGKLQAEHLAVIADILARHQPNDIVFLTHTTNESSKIAQELLDWFATQPEYADLQVITEKSLDVQNSPVVQLLVYTLQFILSPNEAVHRRIVEQHWHYCQQYIASQKTDSNTGPVIPFAPAVKDGPAETLERIIKQRKYLLLLPLTELLLAVIRLLKLETFSDPFTHRLMEQVYQFQAEKETTLQLFLEWWFDKGAHESITHVANPRAIQVMTIHKSKGLEFPVVLLPFCHWTMEPKTNNSGKADLLWVDDLRVQDLLSITFAEESLVPVSVKKPLLHSAYHPELDAEFLRVFIDNLNLLYVACTRPIEELYIFCKQLPKKNKKEEEGNAQLCPTVQYLFDYLTDDVLNNQGLHGLPISSGVDGFSIGQIKRPTTSTSQRSFDDFSDESTTAEKIAVPAEINSSSGPLLIRQLRAYRWQEQVIVKPSAQPFGVVELSEGGLRQLQWGNVVHGILAQIGSFEEQESLLDSLILQQYLNGTITREEQQQLQSEINAVLQALNNVIAVPAGTYQVLNEREIVLPNGHFIRPDRVMVDASQQRAIVIDYKTGKESTVHAQQLRSYAQALTAMGYAETVLYLVYIRTPPEIVQVL